MFSSKQSPTSQCVSIPMKWYHHWKIFPPQNIQFFHDNLLPLETTSHTGLGSFLLFIYTCDTQSCLAQASWEQAVLT